MIVTLIEKTDEVTGATETEIKEFNIKSDNYVIDTIVDGYIITVTNGDYTINIQLNKDEAEKMFSSL